MESSSLHRATLTKGISDHFIYSSIQRKLQTLSLPQDAVLVDIGSGQGLVEEWIRNYFGKVIGVDAMQHENWPVELDLVLHDLNVPGIPLPAESADLVLACEVLPHLENPRMVVRECVRLCRPGGWVVIHVPNILSLLSYCTLLIRRRFVQFQDGAANFMITPLLECDVLRMLDENGLQEIECFYTARARMPFGVGEVPRWLSQRFPRLFSDNLGVIGRKPESTESPTERN